MHGFRSFKPGVVLIGGTSFPIASSLAEGPGRESKKRKKKYSVPKEQNINREKPARKKGRGSKAIEQPE